MRPAASCVWVAAMLIGACGGRDSHGGVHEDAGMPPRVDAGAGVDAFVPPGTDGGVTGDAGQGPCEPTPGPMTPDTYCDLFELALFTRPDATPEARLSGRVEAGTGCTVIDEVEVLEGGTHVTTLPGVGRFASGSEHALLATGTAVPAMLDRCARDDARFGGFGLLVRGRYDGGSFEAHCADAEFGSRWPPALRITCHDNVDTQPFNAYASVSRSSMFTSTTLDVIVPHDPGGALTTANGTLHVIPGSAAFAPPAPMPFDSAGWMPYLSEGTAPLTGPSTNLHMFVDRAAFDTDLCPPPMTGIPDPGTPPPPVFLVRITGTGEHGAYSTEAYVNYCNTITMM